MSTTKVPTKVPLWRDDRFWKITFQILAIITVLVIADFFLFNLRLNMAKRGSLFGFDFLGSQASFDIGEYLIPFQSQDAYGRAFLVGVLNSLKVMIIGVILTTILGVSVGIARFSNNWLVQKTVSTYVDLFRNTPILLQLLFWYFAVFSNLPKIENQIAVLGSFYISNRGLALPWLGDSPTAWSSLLGLIALAIAAFFVWQQRIKIMVEQGASGQNLLLVLLGMGVVALILFIFGLQWTFPVFTAGNKLNGGLSLSAEYCSLLLGLVFYTGAFVSEIVRAGIQSVAKGQWEAAKALGLNSGILMRLVIFPQALRVMIPPLTSEYLNLCKNSSLAIAIAYPDVYAVSSTILNQTGRAIEIVLMIMATYLLINLIIALAMNFLNSSVQIKER